MEKAYVYRSGLIGFADHIPRGTIPLLNQDGRSFTRDEIEGAARRSYDGKDLLVPGVPEAKTDQEAMRALKQWIEWLRNPAATRQAGGQ